MENVLSAVAEDIGTVKYILNEELTSLRKDWLKEFILIRSMTVPIDVTLIILTASASVAANNNMCKL